jgi:glycerol-3-phosphate O-acyltransferase
MFHNYVKESITADFNPYKRREQRKQLIENLGYYIVHRLSEKIVIMSTSVVSAVLLMNRKGVTEDFLINNVHWLSKEILARGYRIGGINKNSPNIAVRNAIAHL